MESNSLVPCSPAGAAPLPGRLPRTGGGSQRPLTPRSQRPPSHRPHTASTCRQVIPYTLLLSVVEYKTLVLRGDMETAAGVLETIPQVRAGMPAPWLRRQLRLRVPPPAARLARLLSASAAA